MKIGDNILCPVFSLSNKIAPFVPNRDNVFGIVKVNGNNFLKKQITKEDLGRYYGDIFLKFKICCVGLSVATIGHFWVQEILLNENLETIWEGSKAIVLVKDTEIDENGPRIMKVSNFNSAEQLMAWISMNYSRVVLYYSMGLFLLRSTLIENTNPEALLNFFKIIEIVVYKRTNKKPKLRVILKENKKLNIEMLDEKDIKDFYEIRGRDTAHDWGKSKPVGRKEVVECKMWADELIIRDFADRGKEYKAKMMAEKKGTT